MVLKLNGYKEKNLASVNDHSYVNATRYYTENKEKIIGKSKFKLNY